MAHLHGPGHGHSHDPIDGHSHAHPHGSVFLAGHPGRPGGEAERSRLLLVLLLTSGFMAVEVVGGILSNSLALLADAGHMLADVGALALSLWAMSLARRPASPGKTYGYVRLEILAALVNGAALLGMSGFIAWAAWRRIQEPVAVDGLLLSGIALGGLLVNVVAARLLHPHAGASLNTRGAYLHVMSDLMGSVGALVAGAVVWATGWTPMDAIVSVLIAALILVSAARLVREATDILLEAAPAHVDVEQLLEDLRDVPELHEVHDLHVWTLTSGFVALSAHGVIDDPYHQGQVLDDVRQRMRRHGIDHVTFQLEPRELVQVKKAGEGKG
ncbi:MAG: cation transporter [Gemmatimonadetes bacterium]|nr:cation transporter [Gemmatimonadota bacterium]